jgi:hypothetical protein
VLQKQEEAHQERKSLSILKLITVFFRAANFMARFGKSLWQRARQKPLTNHKTKCYLAEMKPLQKPVRWTLRMVMRQKTMRFPFAWSARVREKRLKCCLEKNCVRATLQRTAVNSLPELSQANHEKLYESEKRTELIQTTPLFSVEIADENLAPEQLHMNMLLLSAGEKKDKTMC